MQSRIIRLPTAIAVALLAAAPFTAASEPEFRFPSIPGWTDVSPGAPESNFRALSPAQLAEARSGKFAAIGIDLRNPAADLQPNYNVVSFDGVVPVNSKFAKTIGEQVVKRFNADIRSIDVITGPGLPRMRIVYDALVAGRRVRLTQLYVPGREKTAVVTYTASRDARAQLARVFDDHAARISRLPEPRRAAPTALHDAEALANLCRATMNGDAAAMRAALALGADVNDECVVTTPLGWAAREGQVGAASLLLDSGARINQRYGLPKRTALHEAALNGQLEMVRFLVESGADVNARNKHGRTALYYATTPTPPLTAPANADEIARYLVSRGATR